MENLSQLILEISSDEEASFGDIRKNTNGCSVGDEFGDREDHNWLTKLLGEVDKKKDGDSDDVVLVKEVLSDPPKKSSLQSPIPAVEVIDINSEGEGDDDDDDCIVLDGDPEKPVLLLGNGTADDKGENDSDDVEIVAEKGEVACRDFPHSRHLCVKFVFASTLHQNHCSQCHCYVCDSVAPCLNWGTGTSSTDHCHASDKEEYWRTERKRNKKGGNNPKPMPITIQSFLKRRRQLTQAAPLLPSQSLKPVIRPCSVSSNVIAPSVVNPSTDVAHGCISSAIAPGVVNPPPRSSNVMTPGVVNPSTGTAQGHIIPRSSNGIAPGVVNTSPRLSNVMAPGVDNPSPRSSNVMAPGVVNPSTGIAQGHILPRSSDVSAPSVVNPSTGIAQRHIIPRSSNVTAPSVVNPFTGIAQRHNIPGYKRKSLTVSPPLHVNSLVQNCNIAKTSQPFLSPPAPSLTNRRGYENGYCQSQSSREPFLKRCRTMPTSLSNGSHVSNQQNTMSFVASSSAPPIRPQLRPEQIPTHLNRATSAPQMPSQTFLNGNFVNGLPSQSSMGIFDDVINSQPNLAFQPNCSLPSEASVSNQPNCSLPSGTFVSTQPNIGNNTPGSQPRPTSIASSYPSVCNTFENQSSQPHAYNNPSSSIDGQNGFQQGAERDLVTNSVNFDLEWDAFLSERDLRAPIDTSLLQSAAPADNNQYLSVPKDDHDRDVASTGNFQQQSVVAPGNSSSGVTDCFQFEQPMFETRSLSEAYGPISSPHWNEFSPDSF